jgi:hypothetical protein
MMKLTHSITLVNYWPNTIAQLLQKQNLAECGLTNLVLLFGDKLFCVSRTAAARGADLTKYFFFKTILHSESQDEQ